MIQVFYASLTIQAFYYLIIFSAIFFKRRRKIHQSQGLLPPVSVIICARNESANLELNLPLILSQDYPHFEVLVVNDHSADNTPEVLASLQSRYPQLRCLHLTAEEKLSLGKKSALSRGIEAAAFEHLLLTDADCIPAGKRWIAEMAACFSEEQQLVLGLSPYKGERTLLSALVQYETAVTAQQYVNYALWDMPYMGVGRNIAYTKTLFQKSGGLSSHFHIPSGDDDLLVQKASLFTQTSVCLHPDALVYSEAPVTWQAWFRQKTRHYSTGKFYRPAHRFFLGAFLASRAMLYFMVPILMIFSPDLGFLKAFSIFLLGLTLSNGLFKRSTQMPFPWILSPALDSLYVFATTFIGLIATFSKTRHWK